jgi:hypothetical protein
MPKTAVDEGRPKEMIKGARVETPEGRGDLLRNALQEVMEDIAMAPGQSNRASAPRWSTGAR